MKSPFLILLILALTSFANAQESAWSNELNTVLVDEWQDIFGLSLTHPARSSETFAKRFAEFQRVATKSLKGKRLPVYLSPEVAIKQLPALKDEKGLSRTSLPLTKVPLRVALGFVCSLASLQMTVTEHGILLDLKPGQKPQ